MLIIMEKGDLGGVDNFEFVNTQTGGNQSELKRYLG